MCHGVFDIIHYGHLKYLEEAKKYGDRLIVSITTDRYVGKGPGRPYFNQEQRERMLRSIGIVDETFLVDGPTALPAIERYRPDFYVKGRDYSNFAQDPTGEILNEKEAVEKYGGKLIIANTEMHSSSRIINSFEDKWTKEQKEEIEKIRELGGFRTCSDALEKLKSLKVLVLGEYIQDIYRFVRPEGLSSKSPSISCRFELLRS